MLTLVPTGAGALFSFMYGTLSRFEELRKLAALVKMKKSK